jgi:vancomycin resistance protein VanW
VTFQIHTWVEDKHLRGELRADRPVEHSYKVEARDEDFVRVGARTWRRNEIWRTLIDRRTGDTVGEELLKRNCAVVKYPPPEHLVTDLSEDGLPLHATTAPRSTTLAGFSSTAMS